MYFVKTPWWLQALYPSFIWEIPTNKKEIFLTFDDGPHPIATPFVLNELKQYNAKATFFCIGKNVLEHRDIYTSVLEDGHQVGNHTYNHLNGWKTTDKKYIQNVQEAASVIDSGLFRPPYGRITRFQAKLLQKNQSNNKGFKIVMWDVLSADFDTSISTEKCLQNVITNTKQGSIIIFHDSAKAFQNLQFALPKVLAYFSYKGFVFNKLPS